MNQQIKKLRINRLQVQNLSIVYFTFFKRCFGCLLLCLLISSSGKAAEDEIVLTVTGKHGISSDDKPIELTLALLEELPSTSFTSETPWTEGPVVWKGVRLSDLMKYLKTSSTKFHAVALDDYEITFEEVDIEQYPVILAYKKDGEYMSVRELGPLWIMFPFDDFPNLDNQLNRARSIWQLQNIEVL